MKRLILMRHAKSDWSSGAVSDHDRPLNARGRRAATGLGDWMRAQGLRPDQVLCSSAERTGETYLRLALGGDVAVHFSRALYLATADEILHALRGASGDTVLMLGHNPGIGVAAGAVLTEQPQHPKFAQYPSGATLVADFEITRWCDADWGKAAARHFVVPREL